MTKRSLLSRCPSYNDMNHKQDVKIFSYTIKEIPWYSSILDSEQAPGLLFARKRVTCFKISKQPNENRTRNLSYCGAVP